MYSVKPNSNKASSQSLNFIRIEHNNDALEEIKNSFSIKNFMKFNEKVLEI